jgi:hypothetical protein
MLSLQNGNGEMPMMDGFPGFNRDGNYKQAFRWVKRVIRDAGNKG